MDDYYARELAEHSFTAKQAIEASKMLYKTIDQAIMKSFKQGELTLLRIEIDGKATEIEVRPSP